MTTYDDLIAYAPIATYAANRDMITELPNLVRRAQNYVVQRLDHDLFADELVEAVVSIGGDLDPGILPATFLEIRSFLLEGRGGRFFPLLPRAENVLDALYPGSRSGIPLYYARLKPQVYRVYPKPYRALAARLRCNVSPPILSASVQTNILTERYPEIIETALLREAARFNLDMPMAQGYAEELQDLFTGVNAQVGRTTRDETTQRPRDTRNVQGR